MKLKKGEALAIEGLFILELGKISGPCYIAFEYNTYVPCTYKQYTELKNTVCSFDFPKYMLRYVKATEAKKSPAL